MSQPGDDNDPVNEELNRQPAAPPPPATIALTDADNQRNSLKLKVREQHRQAQVDLDFIEGQLRQTEQAMATLMMNRESLLGMRDEAKERVMNAKVAMARFV